MSRTAEVITVCRMLPEEKFHLFEGFTGETDRIITIETGSAVIMSVRNNFLKSLDAEIREGICRYIFPDLFKEVSGGNEFASCWSIYAIKAGADRWRRTNLQMNLFCSSAFPQHLYDFLACCPPHDRVINHNQSFAFKEFPHRVQLDFDPKVPDAVFRLYEGSADIMVSYETKIEGDIALLRESDCGRNAGIRHRDHEGGLC